MLSFNQYLSESEKKPKILKRLVSQLENKGMDTNKAYSVAVGQLQKAGVLKKDSLSLTPKGVKRNKMSAEERAKDRSAKYSGRKPKDFVYSKKTNRATLKDK
jgi:hypothetical protein